MRGRHVFVAALYMLAHLRTIGCFSGDDDPFGTVHQHEPKKPFIFYQDTEDSDGGLGLDDIDKLKNIFHSASTARINKLRPELFLKTSFRKAANVPTVNLLARTDEDLEVENVPLPSRDVIVVKLQLDIHKLNITLLQKFRDGIAAALDVSPQQVHINRLNKRKNCIELYVSPPPDKPGMMDPLPSDEVIRSLNINVLHRSLVQFGITEVTTEKNVLQGQHERDRVWTKEGFYAMVIFLTIFVIIITCLMVLYRLKEKIEFPERQFKEQNREIHLAPIPIQTKKAEVKLANSMVQPEPTAREDTLCQSVPDIKPCLSASPSPFRMKPAGLQERRGSNVSLTLDMSALGSVEPFASVPTPREKVTVEYLQSAHRVLSRQQLREVVANTQSLHSEFAEIPMNFVDPKELDIPSHRTKNRYTSILPNPRTRVRLKNKSESDPLASYINANYIRGYRNKEKAFIATQGPMINTVNDFWQMIWQEDVPIIVMITKLKEKNEKCVLYWPEKRGIYGKVEVLVNSVQECDHYTIRTLTLKQGGQSQTVKHYWYTSWPDHKTPDSAYPLLQLMAEVEDDQKAAAERGPVVVHCSAGIGRTGCFIAASIGCQQLKQEGVVDVLSIVCRLRMDRGGMIQTGEQYEFVHHALNLYECSLCSEDGQ
ncbi:receptor-type tyrosine-protein phosphatase R [Polypterus senegalus]|uniref:receptor-type tyrosine-protein phosphatase R n=1 Tax=Polypterus senegalus TaxID=55291 RepID=UPI0019646171|nr:receptor-type tyrosine-protein phosphatase R [Polypterus senegalus]